MCVVCFCKLKEHWNHNVFLISKQQCYREENGKVQLLVLGEVKFFIITFRDNVICLIYETWQKISNFNPFLTSIVQYINGTVGRYFHYPPHMYGAVMALSHHQGWRSPLSITIIASKQLERRGSTAVYRPPWNVITGCQWNVMTAGGLTSFGLPSFYIYKVYIPW